MMFFLKKFKFMFLVIFLNSIFLTEAFCGTLNLNNNFDGSSDGGKLTTKEEEIFLGNIYGGDKVAESIFGKIKIEKRKISWSGKKKGGEACSMRYGIFSKEYAKNYPDQLLKRDDMPDQMYLIVKLKMEKKKCNEDVAFLQIAFPYPGSEVVFIASYDEGWKNTAVIHMYKDFNFQ
ncbi:MAG: hypothetical protein V4724_03720 [Pseudomonadota bacterium]